MSSDFRIYEDSHSDQNTQNTLANINNEQVVVDGASSDSIPAFSSPAPMPLISDDAQNELNSQDSASLRQRLPLEVLPARTFAPPELRDDSYDSTNDVPILQRPTPPMRPIFDRAASSTGVGSDIAMGMSAYGYIGWLEQYSEHFHAMRLHERMVASISSGSTTQMLDGDSTSGAMSDAVLRILTHPDGTNAQFFFDMLNAENMSIEHLNEVLGFTYEIWSSLKVMSRFLDNARASGRPQFPGRSEMQRTMVVMAFLIPRMQSLRSAIAADSTPYTESTPFGFFA